MPLVTNKTSEDVKLVWDGTGFVFPAGKTFKVDDADMARWFVAQAYVLPNPKAGKPALHRLELGAESRDVKVDGQFLFHANDLPPAKEPSSAQPAPRPADAPRPPGNPKLLEHDVKAKIASMHPDARVREAKKLGVFRKGMNASELTDVLFSKGFRP